MSHRLDREAWQATGQGVTKSQTQLSKLTRMQIIIKLKEVIFKET